MNVLNREHEEKKEREKWFIKIKNNITKKI
jgi:hypothetical protein